MEIIAEIGVNHNNQESILMELVKRVVDCDVDTVKLQDLGRQMKFLKAQKRSIIERLRPMARS